MKVITYEDRQYDTVGLKLLVASLNRHAPDVAVDVIFPSAPASFMRWVAAYPSVNLHTGSELKQGGYNVKPTVLLQALDSGESEVLWLDTDIIVTKDFRTDFGRISSEHLVTTQEWFGAPYQGGDYRSRGWNMEPGRKLTATTNSCVVRATEEHRSLLSDWIHLLSNDSYQRAQKAHWSERPIHLQSDQEVLAALLESRPYSGIPIHFLKRGRDVAHCFQHQGYMAHQMIANLLTFNKPYFVHGQGAKPWREDDTFRFYLDVSTYTLSALEYQDILEEDCWWMKPKTRSGRVARSFFHDNPWTSGLPLALAEEAKHQRVIKTLIKQMLGKP